MPRGVKIALIVFAVVGAGLLSLCIWGYRVVTRSLPQTEGEIVRSGRDLLKLKPGGLND